MTTKIRAHAIPAPGLHPRNPHRNRYDFKRLVTACPELALYVAPNLYGDQTINFADPSAVKALNRALLVDQYGIIDWDIPAHYLCPPVPGRADYLYYLADLISESGMSNVRVLDIGTGANCIYPLIGHRTFGWRFVGSDIDPLGLANARRIVAANKLEDAIELRLQSSSEAIFRGVVNSGDVFDVTMCNPPFHASLQAAHSGTQRKWKNLGHKAAQRPLLNFGGQGAELSCPGGEEGFVCRMIAESTEVDSKWFTTLISKSLSLPGVYRALKKAGVRHSRTIPMAQGQKKSRIVAWTFKDAVLKGN
jgi:23S rRNA (adenine1618-N6)-methyltransferase